MMPFLSPVLGARNRARLTPTRSQSRRLSTVAADPRVATCGDVESLVRAHGVPETKVWAVVDRLASGTVCPTLAWSWAMEHDGGELAEVCAAPVTDRDVAAYMTLGPARDRASSLSKAGS